MVISTDYNTTFLKQKGVWEPRKFKGSPDAFLSRILIFGYTGVVDKTHHYWHNMLTCSVNNGTIKDNNMNGGANNDNVQYYRGKAKRKQNNQPGA